MVISYDHHPGADVHIGTIHVSSLPLPLPLLPYAHKTLESKCCSSSSYLYITYTFYRVLYVWLPLSWVGALAISDLPDSFNTVILVDP